ncbi:MAG: type II toxin-antitoxin system RelE/ParE family toxin [Thermodesulfobacteriota bacterium]
MSWRIEIKPSAEKQYLKLDKKTRGRIKEALRDLEGVHDPLRHPNFRALVGKLHGDFRLRVGNWRILFTPDKEQEVLYVYAVIQRGGAYK